MDALAHFGALKTPWDGKSELPAKDAVYYGGFTQQDVKPTPDSPLLRLGIDKVPPIITSAVLLDAKAYKKESMKAGELVTAKDLEEMLKAQGLSRRGVLPGDVVYVRTGWGDHWRDPDTEKFYYTKAPGLSYDAAQLLAERRVVLISLDTPFIDTVAEGLLAGKAGPAPGTPAGLPFAVHHHMLAQAGIHLLENAKLDELAADKVWTACTLILPLRERGAAGSPTSTGRWSRSSTGSGPAPGASRSSLQRLPTRLPPTPRSLSSRRATGEGGGRRGGPRHLHGLRAATRRGRRRPVRHRLRRQPGRHSGCERRHQRTASLREAEPDRRGPRARSQGRRVRHRPGHFRRQRRESQPSGVGSLGGVLREPVRFSRVPRERQGFIEARSSPSLQENGRLVSAVTASQSQNRTR